MERASAWQTGRGPTLAPPRQRWEGGEKHGKPQAWFQEHLHSLPVPERKSEREMEKEREAEQATKRERKTGRKIEAENLIQSACGPWAVV